MSTSPSHRLISPIVVAPSGAPPGTASPRTALPISASQVVDALREAGCVFAADEAQLIIGEARTPSELQAMLERRVAGFPLEQVVGWAEFAGHRVFVEPGVFVPRGRTEYLLGQAIAALPPQSDHFRRRKVAIPGGKPGPLPRTRASPGGRTPGFTPTGGLDSAPRSLESGAAPSAVVVDMCCGSGAIGLAMVTALERIELHAVDLDLVAVRCARRNIATAGQVYQGDLYGPLPTSLRGRVDLVVANAPYVPTDAIGFLPPEARLHEPRVAFDGGTDGQDVVRRLAAEAPFWLAHGGCLAVETSDRQGTQTAEIFAHIGLIPKLSRSDQHDATVVIGIKRAQ